MRYGYFDQANREYVINRVDVPVSWTNYLGVERMCTVLSHNAGGYSFYRSAQHGRITRFRPNGVPLDRPGHYVYLRDDDSGAFWSISWQPVNGSLDKATYECRHGLSYSIFRCVQDDIDARQRMFIPLGDDVELWDVRIANRGDRPRSLSVFSYLEFSLHRVDLDNQDFQMGLYASGSSYREGVIDYDFYYAPGLRHYLAANFEPDSFDCVRDAFIGSYRSESNPVAVERGICSNSEQLTGNHCGSLHKRLTIDAGGEVRVLFLLGVGRGEEVGRRMRRKYADVTAVDAAFNQLKEHWDDKLSNYQCRTPHEDTNTMLNAWNFYQAETCVTWSRFASFIEVGGRTGLGFRDTAQDAMSVVHSSPDKARSRMLELLRGQASTGFGLHLFDPLDFPDERSKQDDRPTAEMPTVVAHAAGKREINVEDLSDVCSDDHLWLVSTVCEYVKETGDVAFLAHEVPFADGGLATIYEHLKRALAFSAEQVGTNGICKGLRADWNDCLNLGGGESAMVSFLHHWALTQFVELATHLHKTTQRCEYEDDAQHFAGTAARVRDACRSILWDGKWFLRGFTRGGRKIGTATDAQGKIFLNAQSWAVCAGVAMGEQGRQAMDAVHEHLLSPCGLHLLWPAYTQPDDEVGFVSRVYAGVKENGSIFSHPNPWAMIAECMLGRGDHAFRIYQAMLPAAQNDRIEVRQAEPYSYCQFIMGDSHKLHGRARHPWLTGSAGWFYTAATRWMLGVRPAFEGLVIDPCIPQSWPGFGVTRRWRGATYHVTVRRSADGQPGVKFTTLNGAEVSQPISPQPAGTQPEIVVTIGCNKR